jgi:hypothetical protein
MKPLRFSVEWIGEVRGQRLVLARQIDPGTFRQHSDLRLAGAQVLAFDMPRALGADGTPRLDLFGFTLRPDECDGLHEGALVELTGTQ